MSWEYAGWYALAFVTSPPFLVGMGLSAAIFGALWWRFGRLPRPPR